MILGMVYFWGLPHYSWWIEYDDNPRTSQIEFHLWHVDMNESLTKDLDESHATSTQDLDEHARNRCDVQWLILPFFFASDAGVCSQSLKIGVDLMWILVVGVCEYYLLYYAVFCEHVFVHHPWSYLYYWTILTDATSEREVAAGSDVCMVPVQRRQLTRLVFLFLRHVKVWRKKQLLQAANATFLSPSSGVYLFWWFVDVFFYVLMVFICFDDLFLMDFSKKSGKHWLRLWDCEIEMRVRDRWAKAVQRFKELFDIEALAKTFCNEVGSALVIVGHRWSVLEIMGKIWMWEMGIDG